MGENVFHSYQGDQWDVIYCFGLSGAQGGKLNVAIGIKGAGAAGLSACWE